MLSYLSRILSFLWRRILAAAANTPTFATLLVVTTVLGGAMSMFLMSSAIRIHKEEKILSVQPFRNGFMALNDVLRMSNQMLNLYSEHGITELERAEVSSIVDYLYVRANTFHNETLLQEPTPRETRAIQSIHAVVDIMDLALAEGFGTDPRFDYEQFLPKLLDVSEDARIKLVAFLDEADHEQDAIIATRANVIIEQAKAQVVLSVFMSFFALLALLSLRAEAMERLQREDAEKKARYLAYFDPLTELPNRVTFRESCDELNAEATSRAAFVLDLDNFKGINDTLGHAAGDAVLKTTAARLQEIFSGPRDIAARLSGDEFAAWVNGRTRAEVDAIAQSIITRCAEPISADGQMITPGVSVGVALSEDVEDRLDQTVESLLKLADFALYSSKSAGRGKATLSDSDLVSRYIHKKALVDDLSDAVDNACLDLFLQPKFRLPARSPVGFEALLRWQRGGELVSPDAFMEIAEQNGLATDIDIFVLRKAVEAVSRHNRENSTDFSININVSAISLNSDRILCSVNEVLSETGLPAELLTIEVTETALIRNRGNALTNLQKLRDLGTRVALDDFGAGHASLVYVRSLRPDELKIDKSLLNECDTSTEARLILERMINVGVGLGMDVVVEGVETHKQADFVTKLGSSLGQGYLWGHPEPAADALARATEQRHSKQENRPRADWPQEAGTSKQKWSQSFAPGAKR